MQLLKTCSKGKLMNCWESFYVQVLQQNLLIYEQKLLLMSTIPDGTQVYL
jgi:hypothetical protein